MTKAMGPAVIRLLLVWLLAIAGDSAYGQKNPNYALNRTTMVHLFEWKWNDIADECERFLGPKGYAGVQVSPIQENTIVAGRPWWERYQPISYRFETRSGTEAEFRGMLERCNRSGVRVYVDLLLNHMSADHEVERGTGGSSSSARDREYPAVPYARDHFHSTCSINDYRNPVEVRNCELVGLHDLDQANEHVRGRMLDLLDRAIDAGVAGFRIDAAKHMWPKDLEYLYSRAKDLNASQGFAAGSRPYFYQEVIDYGGESISRDEYSSLGAVTEFRHGRELSRVLRGSNQLKWLASWGEAWSLLKSQDALVFVDNHDTQRESGDSAPLTYKQPRLYRMAVAFMLAHPYGTPRVMSSFAFEASAQGPPVEPGTENIGTPRLEADGSCGAGWVCEHRWRQIYNMVGFRNNVTGTKIESWWDNGSNQIAFARGKRGFVAFNGQSGADLKRSLSTNLPAGVYCDVISGESKDGSCTGKSIDVDESGQALVTILSGDEDGVVAFHVGAKAA